MERSKTSLLLLSLALACQPALAQDPFAVPITPAGGNGNAPVTITPGGPGAPPAGTPITGAPITNTGGNTAGTPITGAPITGPGAPAPVGSMPGISVPPSVLNQPFDPANPVAGMWRFRGNDRYGPYQGIITFRTQGNGSYTYERRISSAVPRPDRGDNGTATLTGSHLHTVEVPQIGVSNAMAYQNGKPMRIKNGFYRLSGQAGGKALKANGFYFKSHTERGSEQLQRISAAAPNNHLQLLVDGREAFPVMRAEISRARHSINVQTFIYMTDETGTWFGKLLAQKAREGVQVNLLTDDYGTWISDEVMNDMRGSGVNVILQHKRNDGFKNTLKDIGRSIITLGGLFGGKKKAKRGLFNHDHRKIITIDGRVGFTGGMNIMRLYEYDWHDIHARVEGNVVKDMEKLFWDSWYAAGGKGQPAPHAPITQDPTWWPGSMDIELVDSVPGVHRNIKNRYLSEIAVSRRRILIENAYFLNDEIINALKRKARAGVETVVIIPDDKQNDVAMVVEAFKWVQNDIVRSGVKLYKYRDRMTHGKVAAFDGVVSTVGSANLDDLALEKLYEANLFVKDQAFTRNMEDRIFKVDIPKSDRVKIEKRGFWELTKSKVIHFFRGFM